LSIDSQKAEYKAGNVAQKTDETADDGGVDIAAGKYGNSGMIQSVDTKSERRFVDVADLCKNLGAKNVWVRGRVHTSRCKGKQCFLVLRQQSSTVQCLIAVNDVVSKQMVKFSGGVPKESIVDLCATVVSVPTKIEFCTEQSLELQVTEIFVVSLAKAQLPLQIEDAARSEKSDVMYCWWSKVNH
jgi:aspartyl-tRNA synthetase